MSKSPEKHILYTECVTMMDTKKPKTKPIVGITMGDPTGIGPEILIKALTTSDVTSCCTPVIIGDHSLLIREAKKLGTDIKLNRADPVSGFQSNQDIVDVLSLSDIPEDEIVPGKPTAGTGAAMIRYITEAADLAMVGAIHAMVTCPINKLAMKMAGSEFHGHTELIATRTGTDQFVMMMYGEKLSVVLVTIHMALSKAVSALTSDMIMDTIRVTGNALKHNFGLESPKIAVAGLNPHAGEGGLFGHEEETIIRPAVETAIREGYDITGPLPPDTVFFNAANGVFDVVICMYHDQGLIPFKLIHFKDGVNTTLGLPIIRTSVDHGTAYEIAGKGIADPGSLIEAVKLAAYQASHRTRL